MTPAGMPGCSAMYSATCRSKHVVRLAVKLLIRGKYSVDALGGRYDLSCHFSSIKVFGRGHRDNVEIAEAGQGQVVSSRRDIAIAQSSERVITVVHPCKLCSAHLCEAHGVGR